MTCAIEGKKALRATLRKESRELPHSEARAKKATLDLVLDALKVRSLFVFPFGPHPCAQFLQATHGAGRAAYGTLEQDASVAIVWYLFRDQNIGFPLAKFSQLVDIKQDSLKVVCDHFKEYGFYNNPRVIRLINAANAAGTRKSGRVKNDDWWLEMGAILGLEDDRDTVLADKPPAKKRARHNKEEE